MRPCAAALVLGLLPLVIGAGCGGVFIPPPADGGGMQSINATIDVVLSGAEFPVAMAIAPDGRLFYTEKNTGRVRIIENGQLVGEPFVTVPVANNSERGLLGIALHPDFTNNNFLYVFYTRSAGGPANAADNRVVRFTAAGNTAAGPETLIIQLPSQPGSNHNGGNIHFGPDGKLYISLGDLADSSNAQRIDTPAGKILRINDDGSVPDDNPFGPGNPIYALGLRNSFDFTFDPVSGEIFATENGPSRHDEVNRILRGGNYGWPNVQGFADDLATDPPGESSFVPAFGFLDPPIVDHPEGVVVPTGIDFAPDATFGTANEHQLFVAEFNSGRIIRYTLNEERSAVVETAIFAMGIAGGMTDLLFAPDGTLYASTSNSILHLRPETPATEAQ